MKKLFFTFASLLIFSGCGPSQTDLKNINSLLEQSKTVSCDEIHEYLGIVQAEVQKQIK